MCRLINCIICKIGAYCKILQHAPFALAIVLALLVLVVLVILILLVVLAVLVALVLIVLILLVLVLILIVVHRKFLLFIFMAVIRSYSLPV